jgi:hypothetical protein
LRPIEAATAAGFDTLPRAAMFFVSFAKRSPEPSFGILPPFAIIGVFFFIGAFMICSFTLDLEIAILVITF